MLLCVSFGLTNQVWNYFEYFFVQNIFCVWDFKGRMFENLNFGKTGVKTCVLEKHSISYSCILFLIFNALRSVSKNQVIFSKKMFFQIFDWSNLFFDQSKSCLKILVSLFVWTVSINRTSWIKFFKTWILTFSKELFRKFFKFSLSLSYSDLALPHIFVVFDLSFCKISLSKHR